MTSNDQLDLDAIQTRLDALNALGIPIPGATWQASPRDEKSVIPPEMAHVVEEVLKTGGALLRSSVGVFGDEAHAEFTAHAREDIDALVDEVRRLRARVTELEGGQQPQCGRTRSVNGDDFPPCALRAGHKTAYCQPADGRTCFIAAADQPPAARSAAV